MATIKLVATILSGAALSDEIIAPNGYHLAGLLMPAAGAWTAAGVTFQVTNVPAGTYDNLFNTSGEVAFASDAVAKFLTCSQLDFRGVQVFKVRSGTAATPVNQGADRTISLVWRPLR